MSKNDWSERHTTKDMAISIAKYMGKNYVAEMPDRNIGWVVRLVNTDGYDDGPMLYMADKESGSKFDLWDENEGDFIKSWNLGELEANYDFDTCMKMLAKEMESIYG